MSATLASADAAATWTRGTSSMRLAIFTDTYSPQVNGVARTLERLARAIAARGHEAHVFTVVDPRASAHDDVTRWPGIPFWGYPELRLAAPSTATVVRSLRAWMPTLIHVATPFGVGLAAMRAARQLGIPLVSSYHTSFSQYARFYGLGVLARAGWRYLRWFHNQARRTYVPTNAIATELSGRGFERLHVWPRGVDATVFNPRHRSDELRRSWGAGPNTVVVAYIGRLAKEKGVAVAARGVAAARDALGARARDVKFVVVGDGPYEAQLRAISPPDTLFLGRRTGAELSAAFASADVFVFPSTTDTFGNVLLEAMASRLSVLAAGVPQTREVCERGAELFRAGNSWDLASSLVRLVYDEHRREALRARALRHAQARGWDAVFDALVADYESVIHEARA